MQRGARRFLLDRHGTRHIYRLQVELGVRLSVDARDKLDGALLIARSCLLLVVAADLVLIEGIDERFI